jgi:hypothetical protein
MKQGAIFLKRLSDFPLKSGVLKEKSGHWETTNSGRSTLQLVFNGMQIAEEQVEFREQMIADDKSPGGFRLNHDVMVEYVQGGTPGRSNPDISAAVAKFNKTNNTFWNFAIVQAVIDAAYKAGFDRVYLRNVTTTQNYKRPFITRKGQTEEQVRNRMRALNEKTRIDCGFTKQEQIGDAKYWVIEFP